MTEDRREREARKREEEAAELRRKERTPVFGRGATEHMGEDMNPYVVTYISDDRVTVHLYPLETGFIYLRKPLNYVMDKPVWDHEYDDGELEKLVDKTCEMQVAQSRWGSAYYLNNGNKVTFEKARYYRLPPLPHSTNGEEPAC